MNISSYHYGFLAVVYKWSHDLLNQCAVFSTVNFHFLDRWLQWEKFLLVLRCLQFWYLSRNMFQGMKLLHQSEFFIVNLFHINLLPSNLLITIRKKKCIFSLFCLCYFHFHFPANLIWKDCINFILLVFLQ